MPLHFSRTVFPLLWGTVENSLYVIVYFPDSISESFAVSKLAWLCYYDNKWTKMLTWLFGTLIGGLFRILKDIKKGRKVKLLENSARAPADFSASQGFGFSALQSGRLLIAGSWTHRSLYQPERTRAHLTWPLSPAPFPDGRGSRRTCPAQASLTYQHL